jgi:hypothetical protein
MSLSENRCPPRIKCGAGFFRDMLDATAAWISTPLVSVIAPR